ncbi:MAG: FAD-dependent thymidylate synthase [Acidimicrobiia bacterium]
MPTDIGSGTVADIESGDSRGATMTADPVFHIEEFTDSELAILNRHFTNTDLPVFGIIGLPEVVKGALFARYSRSPKSIRRLFLDEFASEASFGLDADPAGSVSHVGVARAQQLYDRVFTQYGDDSVAQLGGAHIAVEQASNILTKVLEWGRLASYLEQSTRYIFYDKQLGGRYRYHIPSEIDTVGLTDRYRHDMDRSFATYSDVVARLVEHYEALYPKADGDSDYVWRSTIRAKACDDARGLLPASTTSNVGIFASGQAYEALLVRMRSHPLQEVRMCSDLILGELRKMIPAFMKRVDVPDRGGAWSRYFTEIAEAMGNRAAVLGVEPDPAPIVTLVDFDPHGEQKVAAAALYAHTDLPDAQIRGLVDDMTDDEIDAIFTAFVGDRTNRRHKPGRGMEQTYYRFDVLCDYGIFRDLQRHRMLTIEWQDLTTDHGYATPPAIDDIGARAMWDEAMERAALLVEDITHSISRTVAQYAVPFASRIRFVMNLNAREAFHLIELRTQQGGHPDYRRVCQEMHRAIAEVAGHRRIAEAMSFVDHSEYDLARLETERKAASRRAAAGITDPSV